MPVKMEVIGDYKLTRKFLEKAAELDFYDSLKSFGAMGVGLLSQVTPKKTGRTAGAWRYKVTKGKGKATIEWFNDNSNKGVPIAIILQYGHATGTGGYVSGIDYINPVTEKVFREAVNKVWGEVTKS